MTPVMKRFSEVARVVTGKTPSTSNDLFFGGHIPFVTPGDLDGEDPIVATKTQLTTEGAGEVNQLPKGSVLVSCIGTLGKVGIAGVDVCTNQQINALVFDGSLVEPRYGYHFCKTLRPYLEGIAPATTLPIINKSRFSEIGMPLPPLPEQRRIAMILDKADALLAKRRETIAKLDQLMHSVFLEMFGDPIKNPKDWQLHNLAEATFFQEGPGILAKDFRDAGVPLVRLAGINDGKVSLKGCNFVDREMFERKWSQFALSEGDILVLTSATFGKPAVVGKEAVGSIFYTGIIRFNPRHAALSADFLRAFLASPWFLRQAQKLASGAVIKHFGPTHLKQMHIPIPPIELQLTFAQIAENIIRQKGLLRKSIEGMEKLFGSLQHRAFDGSL